MLGTSFVTRLENCVVFSNAEVTLLRQKTYQMKRPQAESSRSKPDGKGIDCKQLNDLFKVTPKEGIVYVDNVNVLDKITSGSLNLMVEKKTDSKKYSDKTRDKNFNQLVSNITITIRNSSQSWIKFKSESITNCLFAIYSLNILLIILFDIKLHKSFFQTHFPRTLAVHGAITNNPAQKTTALELHKDTALG